MKKLFYACFALFLALLPRLSAQIPGPCPQGTTPPADDCSLACLLCTGLDTLVGSTAGYTAGLAPGFCGTIENDQWIAFTAAATSGTFTATPSNCQNGDGIQLALYEDCGMAFPIACHMGASGGGAEPVTIAMQNLSAGHIYYLLIDGFAGDVCDFTLVLSPPQGLPPDTLGTPGVPSGPTSVCPGGTVTYSIAPVLNAGTYTWTAPPGTLIEGLESPVTLPAPGGQNVGVTWGNVGGLLCVTPGNGCANGSVVCRNVAVTAVPPTTLPPVVLCAEEAPYELPWGMLVNASGFYSAILVSSTGCDSVVQQQVTIKAPLIIQLPPRFICPGECFEVCGTMLCAPGTYSLACPSFQGCDSIVNVVLALSAPLQVQAPDGKSLTCANPSLTLNGNAPAGLDMEWLNAQGQVIGTSPGILITAPGFYTFRAGPGQTGAFCTDEKTILVKQNTQAPQVSASGGTLDANHPTVQLQGASITSGATFFWTGPGGFTSNQASPTVAVSGSYTLTVTYPGNGCTSSVTVLVTQG